MLLLACLAPLAHGAPPAYAALASARSETFDPFAWESGPSEVRWDAQSELVLWLRVPDGHVVRSDAVGVQVSDAGGLWTGAPVLPEAELLPATASHGEQRVYTDDVRVVVPVRASAGTEGVVPVSITVRHQGCAQGLCYPQITSEQVALVRVRSDRG